MKEKVAIVNSSSFGKYFPEHIEKLAEKFEVQRFEVPAKISGKDLAEMLKGFKYIIASTTPFYDKEFFKFKDEMVIISRHGLGYDNIDIDEATKNKVIVTKVDGSTEREAVAEHAVALCMSVLRKVPQAYNKVADNKWSERQKFFGIEIKDKVVGVIGFGNIGSRVGEIMCRGFNADVLVYDPFVKDEFVQSFGATKVSLEELLAESDIIFICSLLTKENYHMLSEREFQLMKKGVYIINTSRGELIDLQALLSALESGKVAGVGFDVVEGEPIGADHPLLKFDNVIITPHIAAYTYESIKGMGDKVINDILQASEKIFPRFIVNTEVINILEESGWRKI